VYKEVTQWCEEETQATLTAKKQKFRETRGIKQRDDGIFFKHVRNWLTSASTKQREKKNKGEGKKG